MVSLTRAAVLIGVILVFNRIAYVSDWYSIHEWLDIPMHFAGGFAMGFLALALWNHAVQNVSFQKNLHPALKVLFHYLAIVGCVALVGIAWEWYEFLFDYYASQVSVVFRPLQMGIGDTMADFFFDLLGGSVAFLIFRNRE